VSLIDAAHQDTQEVRGYPFRDGLVWASTKAETLIPHLRNAKWERGSLCRYCPAPRRTGTSRGDLKRHRPVLTRRPSEGPRQGTSQRVAFLRNHQNRPHTGWVLLTVLTTAYDPDTGQTHKGRPTKAPAGSVGYGAPQVPPPYCGRAGEVGLRPRESAFNGAGRESLLSGHRFHGIPTLLAATHNPGCPPKWRLPAAVPHALKVAGQVLSRTTPLNPSPDHGRGHRQTYPAAAGISSPTVSAPVNSKKCVLYNI
jgi:hypothetical protein